jgi:hypothetical protein
MPDATGRGRKRRYAGTAAFSSPPLVVVVVPFIGSAGFVVIGWSRSCQAELRLAPTHDIAEVLTYCSLDSARL